VQEHQPTVGELTDWLSRNRSWQWRSDPNILQPGIMDDFLPRPPSMRLATTEEVAESVLDDPRMQSALGALSSAPAAIVEQAVLQNFVSPGEAELLTKALDLALRTVKDKRKPLWLRAGLFTVVVGTVVSAVVWAVSRREG
jgi:hypothetical protein